MSSGLPPRSSLCGLNLPHVEGVVTACWRLNYRDDCVPEEVARLAITAYKCLECKGVMGLPEYKTCLTTHPDTHELEMTFFTMRPPSVLKDMIVSVYHSLLNHRYKDQWNLQGMMLVTDPSLSADDAEGADQ